MSKLIGFAIAVVLSAATPVSASPSDNALVAERVDFRTLFTRQGKASARADDLNGRRVAIMGYFAPAPTRESPFRVMTGAPTATCPYCTAVNEEAHLPYVLVYPRDQSFPRYGERNRFVVVGTISASHAHEAFYGLHNDVRIVDAEILPVVPARRRLGRPAGEMLEPAPSGEAAAADAAAAE